MRGSDISPDHRVKVDRAIRDRVEVLPSGCWELRNVRSKSGYGTIHVPGGGALLAHRASWILANGAIPAGMYICHRCDHPPCVNPAHLFLGTPRDNVADMHAKARNRNPRGHHHWNATLSPDEVSEIRRRYRSGVFARHGTGTSSGELSEEFGISREQIVKIANGKKWKEAA